MFHKLNWVVAAGCAVCLTVGMLLPADADVFNWTYNGQFGQVSDNGSGTFTTGASDIGNDGFPGVDITAITGTWNGSIITGLLPVQPGFANNILYPMTEPIIGGFFDIQGVVFSAIDARGVSSSVNIFFVPDAHVYQAQTNFIGIPHFTDGTFTLTPAPVPVPIVGTGLPGLILAGGVLLLLA
jgi:hypothetical protein